MYSVSESNLIGKPETPVAFMASFTIDFEGIPLSFEKPIIRRYSKPDKGEIYEPFVVLPKATADFDDDVIIFSNGDKKQVTVNIKAGKDDLNGSVSLQYPEGWEVENNTLDFSIEKKGGVVSKSFTIIPPNTESEGCLLYTSDAADE